MLFIKLQVTWRIINNYSVIFGFRVKGIWWKLLFKLQFTINKKIYTGCFIKEINLSIKLKHSTYRFHTFIIITLSRKILLVCILHWLSSSSKNEVTNTAYSSLKILYIVFNFQIEFCFGIYFNRMEVDTV